MITIFVAGCGLGSAVGEQSIGSAEGFNADAAATNLMVADVPDLIPIPGSGHPVIVKPEGRVLIAADAPAPLNTVSPVVPLPPSPLQPQPPSSAANHSKTSLPIEPHLPAEPHLTTASNPRDLSDSRQTETSPHNVAAQLDAKGSITFRKTPLNEVIFLLSDLWKVNIVAADTINGEVSGTFFETPLREVLSAVLNSSGYSYRQTGNSLIVLPMDQVGSDNPDFVSRLIQLPSAAGDSDTTIDAVQLLLSDRGQIRKLGNGAILIVDRPERIDNVQELISHLSPQHAAASPAVQDLPAPAVTLPTNESFLATDGIAYFTPQFTEAEEMTESLQAALGDTITVATYAKENRIMIKGTPDQLRLAAQAIEQLDIPRPQVRITALIYDVSLKEAEGLGVNWSHGPHSRATSLLNAGTDEEISVFRNAIEAGTDLGLGSPTSSLGFRTLNNSYDATVALQALSATSEAKILADPTVTVGDRCQASIKIVQRLPIVTSIVTSTGSIPQVEFEEAGIILNVTPRISRDGTIEMQVRPEYSVVAEYRDAYPVIDSRNAETTVRVGNGQLFAMGGLRQKSITETVRGVPYLKDVKYIGRLFRSHGSEVRESELIVFLKPEIITQYAAGTLRENQAACVANALLDQVPYASLCPNTPDCRNPDCPNHHPRVRVNGGSVELEMIGGCGIGCLEPMNSFSSEIPIDSMSVPSQVEIVLPSP
ncbi:type II secretion system protein GspD [Novipirellula caenicola]|uniref:type II secretion system protein GspD n=1 Tax=Novipirellula caenicola TaxID=1536901 RepID=UPI0031F1ABF4